MTNHGFLLCMDMQEFAVFVMSEIIPGVHRAQLQDVSFA